MNINQAFEILSNAGGRRAARVIIENTSNLNRIKIWWMARQLRKNVPVAKIIHMKWFYGLKFYTNKHTLDPRPDSETLVSAVISDVDAIRGGVQILDIGTGTGCIAAALVKNIFGATSVAVDVSAHARWVARKNVRDLGLAGRIDVRRGDFNNPHMVRERFDIIVSNPPYIADGDERVDLGAMHDPKLALYAKNNGLAAYVAIAKNAQNWITPGGKIYLEIGAGQGCDVQRIFTNAGWKFIRSDNDLGGIERVLVFQSI